MELVPRQHTPQAAVSRQYRPLGKACPGSAPWFTAWTQSRCPVPPPSADGRGEASPCHVATRQQGRARTVPAPRPLLGQQTALTQVRHTDLQVPVHYAVQVAVGHALQDLLDAMAAETQGGL